MKATNISKPFMITTNASGGMTMNLENSNSRPSITRMTRWPAMVLPKSRTESERGLKNSPMMLHGEEDDIEG